MNKSTNVCTLIGPSITDLERSTLQNGTKVAEFKLVTTKEYRGSGEEVKLFKHTHKIMVFGQRANDFGSSQVTSIKDKVFKVVGSLEYNKGVGAFINASKIEEVKQYYLPIEEAEEVS